MLLLHEQVLDVLQLQLQQLEHEVEQHDVVLVLQQLVQLEQCPPLPPPAPPLPPPTATAPAA